MIVTAKHIAWMFRRSATVAFRESGMVSLTWEATDHTRITIQRRDLVEALEEAIRCDGVGVSLPKVRTAEAILEDLRNDIREGFKDLSEAINGLDTDKSRGPRGD